MSLIQADRARTLILLGLGPLYLAGRRRDKERNPRETAMARTLIRLAALAGLSFAAAAAFGQAAPQGPPSGTPGGNAPPGGLTAGVNGNTPSIADQVDQMNRHINGE